MKNPRLIPAERHQKIHEIIRTQGTVRVSKLSKLLGVSELTIRRDLEQLELDGILERTHGGAVYSSYMQLEPLFSEKDSTHRQEKQQIGYTAASLIKAGDTIFINSGSTTLQIFRNLTIQKNLRVITSNVGMFAESHDPEIELILIGGTYRQQSNSVVGPLAIRTLKQVHAKKCFIGVDGLSLKYGLTTPVPQEAEIARTMISRTEGPRIVVVDHSKFGKVSDMLTATLNDVDILIVDSGFDETYREGLEAAGVRIIVSPPVS